MDTAHATLSPAEARILNALLHRADRASDRPQAQEQSFDPFHTPAPILDLTRSLGLAASELLDFSASTAVAAALDTIRRTLAAIDAIRLHSLRALAINTLATVASTSADPIERRRAASALLRATTPTPTRKRARERPTQANGWTLATPAPTPTARAPVSPAPSHPLAIHSTSQPPPPTIQRAAPAIAPPPTPPVRAPQPAPIAPPPPHHAEPSHLRSPATTPGRAIPDLAPTSAAAADVPPPNLPTLSPRRHPTRAALLTSHAGAPPRPP